MLSLRKSNVLGLLETGVVVYKPIYDPEDETKVLGHELVTSEDYIGEERQITLDVLVELAETLSASKGLAYSFTFNADAEEYPWSGGIYKWHDPLPMPTNEEEAKKLEGVPLKKLTDRWMSDEPDIAVFDRDMPNLMCQLVTALSELFENTLFKEDE